MTLNLDPRQRAMLAEMGVRVWLPDAPAPEESTPAHVPAAAHAQATTLAKPIDRALPTAAQALEPVMTQLKAVQGVSDMDWQTLQTSVAQCHACGLCQTRKNTVFGTAASDVAQPTPVDWMVVGEVPGAAEDAQAQPFVGEAGQLLDNMLRACGLSRKPENGQGSVFITQVLKCSTPGNRNPKPEELAQCVPYLHRQIALLQPKMIVVMGRFAANALLQASVPDVQTLPLGKLRGQVHRFNQVPVVVTYHPAYVMRNLPEKAKVWADLCLAMAHLSAT